MPDPNESDTGVDATRVRDDPTEVASLKSTEVDPYATSVPTDTGSPLDSSFFEESYSTKASGEASDKSNQGSLASTQSWKESGKRAGTGGSTSASRYRHLKLHARGGLGEVYVAVDGELNREVALKEIQGRHLDRSDTQFRFIFEAEVTGGLEHPGIVPVYGLGRYPDGRPYYAMRFIRGDSLKAAIKKFHESAAAHPLPSTSIRHSLEFRQLLARFVAVCHAIDYAHSRGVIHRDIKPENIMLGPYGETLVVDWGLAKALSRPDPPDDTQPKPLRPLSGNDTSATMVGAVMGTPSFMSPEQAAGEVETLGPATDIFSLGSTLYNMLTGHAPFRDKELNDLLEHVRKAEFPTPRSLNNEIPPALEAICLKAMARYPGHRYPNASALADDIERWLADEPTLAYPEPWTIRAARWARRHRTAVAASFALLLTASTALGISTVLIKREKDKTERNYQRARSAVEQMLDKVGEVDLADIPQMESVRPKLLERALGYYHDFLNERGNDASSRLETGRALGRLGDIDEMRGLYVQAESSYRDALRLLSAPTTNSETRRALARARNNLGILLKKSNRFAESETFLRQALLERQALAKEDPKNLDDARSVSNTLYQLGTLLAKLKDRTQEDEEFYRQAIRDQEALVVRPTSTAEDSRQLARYLNNLGILQSGSYPGDAEATFIRATEIQAKVAAESANNASFRSQQARTWNNLANLYLGFRQYDKAATDFSYARSLYEGLAADFPGVPDYRRELAMTLNNLGRLLEVQPSEKETPADLFRRAIQDQRQLTAAYPEAPDHKLRLAVSLCHLGTLLASSAVPEAESSFAEAIQLQEKLVADYPQVPEYLAAYGLTLTERALPLAKQGKRTEALDLLNKAIETLERAREGNPREQNYARFLYEARRDRARTLLELGRHADVALEAGRIAQIDPKRPEGFISAAEFLGRCFELAGSDTALAESKRRELQETYAQEVIKALRNAIDCGSEDRSRLDGPAFKSMKGRPDFEKLREDWKAKGQKATV
jgi:eukaryotic-like serine/threonine-protein kinase